MRHDYLEITSTCVWNISKLIITLGFFQMKEIHIYHAVLTQKGNKSHCSLQ